MDLAPWTMQPATALPASFRGGFLHRVVPSARVSESESEDSMAEVALRQEVATGLQETNDRFCREAVGDGDSSAFDRIYTRQAKVLPPGAPMVEGIEAIKAFWRQTIAGMGLTSAKLTTVTVEMCGESAVEIGHAELSLKDGVTIKAKYIVHWKQEDGGWRWDKDIWNAD